METLERSRVCRLCGKHTGKTIDIFHKGENHVKKINSVLPILVHEMDLLPKHICHPCNYKLQEFHKFYEDCLKTDANLKGQLSWMQGSMKRGDDTGVPMVQINNIVIKTEPPDYDEQVSTDAIFQSKNFNNYIDNNYPERIFNSSKTECSHCGCYCGNKNVINDELSKTKPTRHDNEKNNNDKFTMRDTIKRNLFATEIFDNKISKIQTRIPVGNVSQEFMRRQNGGRRVKAKFKMAVDSNKMAVNTTKITVNTDNTNQITVNTDKIAANSNKITDNTDKMAVNTDKMAANTNKMAARKLRPRKTCSTNNSQLLSSPPVMAKSRSKSSSKEINAIDQNTLKSIAIKLEVLEDLRSLRPRMDVIDYSDSKRKNPLARTDDRKRQKIDDISIKPNLATPLVSIKIEPNELTKISSSSQSQKTVKILSPSRRALKKPPKIIFEEFLKSAINEQILSIKGVKSSDSSQSRSQLTKITRKRNLMEYESQNFHYLRSQRGQLRNGKLMTIDSIVEKPKKIHNLTNEFNVVSIKREKSTGVNEKTGQITFKHRDCDMCNCRFASAELYMLHHCYANKRH